MRMTSGLNCLRVLSFLREIVRPTYPHARWQLRRVLTDDGKEFKGVFAVGCERLLSLPECSQAVRPSRRILALRRSCGWNGWLAVRMG